MDIRKGKLNIIVSILFKVITMVLSIAVKSTLVNICGNEVNGLNALYISIIGVLTVAELGIGSAITFSMYKPIVDGDIVTLSALYQLFRRLYLVIGVIIFVGGLAVMPFLPILAKDYTELNINMYVTFLLVLISVSLTYLFNAKTSLINAYKNNYITTAITQGGIVLQYILQIIVLLITRSFAIYLVCRIVAVLLQWIATEIITKKQYNEIFRTKGNLSNEMRFEIKKNIKAMFMHKVGAVLVNTVDSIIISAFIGVIVLGKYSNYTMILASVSGIVSLVFSSLTSVIGHLCVEENNKTTQQYFESFHLLNFLIGVVFFLGYYAIIDELISILFSAELVMPRSISLVITINGFVQFMRRNTLTFRDATGCFYDDRWKPLFEGLLNAILSIILVKSVGVAGVIVATIITNMIICHVIEPRVLYKNAFGLSPRDFYIKNYSMIFAFIISLIVLHFCLQTLKNVWSSLLLNGVISLVISFFVCLIFALVNKNHFVWLVKIARKG